ncbi:unnamed protein product [Lymnaea stagnalis]|uniref:Nucleolar protein 11 C-terminal domain-containing protein n=1 Tax=Lymnaea stagnalis TaxID=6523 RepID=A0AAV2H1A4_LYMST
MAVNDRQAVESCIEKGDLCKLLRLPEVLDDFSEASIIKSIEWLLKVDEKHIEKASKNVQYNDISKGVPWLGEDVDAPFTDKKCYALNVMLGQKFSPQFLQEEARSMSFDSVLILIKYLQFLLTWLPSVEEQSQCLPTLEQIIDWLDALVDGHFQQLKLAEDANSILESLHQQVTVMANWQLESKTLQGTLSELNRRFEEQQKNMKMGDYCIEVISF